MTSVLSVFLDVQMGADSLFELFVNDFTGTDSDCATHQVDDTRATVSSTSELEHADGNVKSSTSATSRAVALLRWPSVRLQVIEDRVEGELTLGNRHEELAERIGVTLVERVTGLT